MAEYRRTVHEFGRCFAGLKVRHISCYDSDVSEALDKMGSKHEPVPQDVFLRHLYKSLIKGGDKDYPLAAQSTAIFLVTLDGLRLT